MIDVENNRTLCSGCGACRDICPVSAISLIADEEGFQYPEVDNQKCIECGTCISVCAVASAKKAAHKSGSPVAYASYTKSEPLRMESSSGGVFSELAQAVLAMGGVVFGAAFDQELVVKHICVDKVEDSDKLRGSKYVQSETGTTYLQAKEYLEQGRTVLYTGTPCQIGGLLSFLGKPYENLYTQDIICHGVPSPTVWKKYKKYREVNEKAKVCKAGFRHKKYGWRTFSMQMEFSDGTQYIQPISDDLYMRGFLRNLCLRPSCYNCAFKTKHRQSDLTLADFWGVEKVCPEMDDDKGTSLVIIHSEKGEALFERAIGKLECRNVDLDDAIRYNSAMTMSVAANPKRESFIQTVREKGFGAAKKYVRVPLRYKIKRMIKSVLGR